MELERRHRPEVSDKLRVIQFTDRFPSLPYVVDASVPIHEFALIREALKNALADDDAEVADARRQLLIDGFCFDDALVSHEAYDRRARAVMEDVTRGGIQPERPTFEQMEGRLLRQRPIDEKNVLDAVKIVSEMEPVAFAERVLEDCRWARICHPSGEASNPWPRDSGDSVNCIAFFGVRPMLCHRGADDCAVTGRCWALDQTLLENLDPEIIRGYFSFNLAGEPSGNVFNLVVFRDGHDARTLGSALGDVHREAIHEISPHYYDRVRVHRCRVSRTEVNITQTTAVNYSRGKVVYRNVHKY